MSYELWISFALASLALQAVPGPTVMVVISYALNQGRATAWATVPGVALGDFTAMSVSLLGAGAVLAASATLFTILKFVGALYLIWLGIQLWRAGATALVEDERLSHTQNIDYFSIFLKSFTVTALNPKGIVFFVAFVPQFVNTANPVLPQFALLTATFVGFAAINVLLWALLANSLRAKFNKPGNQRLVSRISGSFLIAAGVVTATIRRAS